VWENETALHTSITAQSRISSSGIVRRIDDTECRGTDQVRRYAKTTEKKGKGENENEIQQMTAKRTIRSFRNKGQAIVYCLITRREFSCCKYQAI
jgi:hypothetical protein